MNKDKFMGIDLHTNRFNCRLIDENGNHTKLHFEINQIEEFKSHLDKDTHVLVEASTNTFSFVDQIKDHVGSVEIANPFKMKLISMVNKKTDTVDAEKLAVIMKMQHQTSERLSDAVYLPNQTIRDLRSLFSTLSLLKKQLTISKNRIHSIFKQNLMPMTNSQLFTRSGRSVLAEDLSKLPLQQRFQVELLYEEIDSKEALIRRCEEQIKLVGLEYLPEVRILTSIKGISVMASLALVADIGDINRFSTARKLCSYLRSSPSIDASNENVRIGSTNKQGRKLSLCYLSQSVNHFRDSDPVIHSWYSKRSVNKGRGKLRMAICRKVLVQVYHMLKNKSLHYATDSKNHSFKLNAYLAFFRKRGFCISDTIAA